jgi:hypothetical protein
MFLSRGLWMVFVAVALTTLIATTAHARIRPAPEGGAFYYPFPYYYEPDLVKVFSGITPGTTTLEEMLERRGKPKAVVNNRYFYYEWRDWVDGQRDFQEVYIEFRESKRLGKQRLSEEGLDLTAVVSRIFVYSTRRMERYATYIDQVAAITLYPYDTYYDRKGELYTMLFPYQGYGMYFNSDGRFVGEVFFEPERYEVRRSVSISVGDFKFSFVKRDELPLWLHW